MTSSKTVAELWAELEAANAAVKRATDALEVADAESAALRAELERLRDVRTEHDWQFKKRQEAESRLAAANALVERVRSARAGFLAHDPAKHPPILLAEVFAAWDESLAAQPATAPVNPYTCEPDCESPRCPVKKWERENNAQPATAPDPCAHPDIFVGPDGLCKACGWSTGTSSGKPTPDVEPEP